MTSLPAKPSTGGMFYHVSVCVVMNYCTINAMGYNLWKEGSAYFNETISVQMWESYIISLTSTFDAMQCWNNVFTGAQQKSS